MIVLINIRFGSHHLFLTSNLKWSISFNPHHQRVVRSWWPPEVQIGEFRRKPDWKWLKCYRFFGVRNP